LNEVISLLLPTRQRPQFLRRLAQSARATSKCPELLELVAYVDDDDDSYADVQLPLPWSKINGPRLHDGHVNLSIKWNECWKQSTGDIFMHCGDDIILRTKGWDEAVRDAINSKPGKICFTWCNDYSPTHHHADFGTHGFIHRNWTDVVGRFVPPYFVSDFNDTWFNDVADALGVRVYLREHLAEHMHYTLGKAKLDVNTRERLRRHEDEQPQNIYYSPAMEAERQAEVDKLRRFVKDSR
jgi:hypothetical protein